MVSAEYFRRQAAKLQDLARSLKERAQAQPYVEMAADFHQRADELERESAMPAYVHKRGAGSGETDRG